MSRTLIVVAASGLGAIAVATWLWLAPGSGREAGQEPVSTSVTSTGGGSDGVMSESPFAVAAENVTSEPQSVVPLAHDESADPATGVELPFVDVSQIAQGPMSDTDFEAMVARLQADPALLQQLIDEFRQEQDPERLALLARLLGETGGEAVTQIASELIFSGNEASRELGLQLLRQVQPGNAQARDIASGLLATEVEPGVLVSTLTALASPGTVDADSRALLSDQVALLASHTDAGVRGISLDILSRWSTDGRDTPVLINGLQDPEPRVRESAAYALVGHEDSSDAVVESLFSVARDPDEPKPTRSAAFMALSSLSLSDAQSQELQIVKRELSIVRR